MQNYNTTAAVLMNLGTIKPNYTILRPFVPQFGDCVTQNVKVKDYTAVEEGRRVVGYTGMVRPNAKGFSNC